MADSPAASILEPSSAELKEYLEKASVRLCEFLDTLPGFRTPELSALADFSMPRESLLFREKGVPLDSLLDLLFGPQGRQDGLVYQAFNTTGAGYLAYVPGGGMITAAIADLIADIVNRYVGLWAPAPGLVNLEAEVIRWLCGIVGYPPEALGFLTTGGSQANHSAVIVARCDRLGERLERGIAYVSDQVHHSVNKSFFLAGIPRGNLRVIPTDRHFRMDLRALKEYVRRDRKAGWQPFMVVGSGGTTNTGSIDDLPGMARIAREENLWFHIDAAYGGFFLLTERGRRGLDGVAQSDSITLDPHKGLFLPYGTGSLLVRDRGGLYRAFSSGASYLPTIQSDQDRIDFCEISPELSRDFRGLRVWLPLQLAGVEAFRQALDEKLDLALWAADELRRIPSIEILADPELSTVAFRLAPEGRTVVELDQMNRDLLDEVNRRGRTFISGTRIGGCFALRFCIVSFRTHLEHVEEAVGHVREAAQELL